MNKDNEQRELKTMKGKIAIAGHIPENLHILLIDDLPLVPSKIKITPLEMYIDPSEIKTGREKRRERRKKSRRK